MRDGVAREQWVRSTSSSTTLYIVATITPQCMYVCMHACMYVCVWMYACMTGTKTMLSVSAEKAPTDSVLLASIWSLEGYYHSQPWHEQLSAIKGPPEAETLLLQGIYTVSLRGIWIVCRYGRKSLWSSPTIWKMVYMLLCFCLFWKPLASVLAHWHTSDKNLCG